MRGKGKHGSGQTANIDKGKFNLNGEKDNQNRLYNGRSGENVKINYIIHIKQFKQAFSTKGKFLRRSPIML